MNDVAAVTAAAGRLNVKDEESLLVELGMRERAIAARPELSNQAELDLRYDSSIMGPLDEIKALGRRILVRWSKELYNVICGSSAEENETRKNVLASLNLGEAAIIAAVASALLWVSAPAALAAALAPLIVKKFIAPAGEELCAYWGEAINAVK